MTTRYGIVGVGMMGLEHIGNINAIEGAEVVAYSDPFEGSRSAAAELVPGAVGHEDHVDMLADIDLDAIVVASPNHTHRSVMDDVLASGRHVLIEKPMCTTVTDCVAVVEQTAKTAQQFPDRVVQVGLEYRYMPAVARMIDELKSGSIGAPRMVSIREHRFPFLEKVNNWNRFSSNTGGTLVEKCCHFFDLMNLIVEERPVRVLASGAQDVNHLDEVYDGRPSDIMDNAYVIVDYESGARAMLDLCMFAEASYNQEEVSVVGEKGKVEAFLPEGVFRRGLRGTHGIGDVESELVDTSHIAYEGLHHGSSYVEHLEFIAAIENGTPPPITVTDGLWSVAVGAAAHLSIEQGRAVELAELLGSHGLEVGATAAGGRG